jgi:hypothetical protein
MRKPYATIRRPNTALQSDRFAREIMVILALSGAARSRRLNAIPLNEALRAGDSSLPLVVSPTCHRSASV